ncbi:MAG TPA: hypothetical protein VFI27_07050 [candidate division Zixibacteria bacterium]|nr:hypothetical protein [candidate division Zixibacteria bacterium]
MIKVKTLILALLLLLAAGCAATEDTNDGPIPIDTEETAQIYATTISHIYNVDHSFGGPGRSPGWPLVYVVTTTDDSAMGDAPAASSQKLSTDLQEAIAAEVAGETFELIWIEAFNDAPIDPSNGQIAEGEGIIITLGNLHPQDDSTVQLSFIMACGGLCGIGKTYVLNQVNDVWQITASVGPEIMS